MSSLSCRVVAKAESFAGIRAGIANLEEVQRAPSYCVVPKGEWSTRISNERKITEWPKDAKSVLVLGLHHAEDDPQLDWWDGGNTLGNRLLMRISDSLQQWLKTSQGLSALPLPYYVEWGGLFLKDAAVLSGIGVVGRNNLLLNPEWGPRIRFRSILIEEELAPSRPVENFDPCETCGEICRSSCPQDVFCSGSYDRAKCIVQLDADRAYKTADGEVCEDWIPRRVVKYCRICEFACPTGSQAFNRRAL